MADRLILLLLFVGVLINSHAQPNKYIVGGDFDYPPFSYIDKTGKASGLDIDILNAISAETGIEFEYRLSKWDSALILIQSENTDIIAGIIFSTERENTFDYTNPLHTENYSIFIRKDLKYTHISDLYNYKLMVLKGDISIREFLMPTGLYDNHLEAKSLPEAIAAVEWGRADYVVAPHSLGMNEIAQNNYKNITVKGPPLIPSIYCLAVKKGNTQLLGVLNKGISELRSKGELSRIQNKWIKYSRDEFKYKQIAKYIGITFLIVLILLTIVFSWVVSLRKQIKIKTEDINYKNQELRKLNSEKDKFLSIIAHDLRSPFNAILGYSDILIEHGNKKDVDKMIEYSKIINDSSIKAMDLLKNLVQWAQAQSDNLIFKPECFEMNLIIDEVLLLSDEIAKYKAISIKKSTASLLPVFADKEMIRAVIRNLISNAIKYTQEGGEIIVKGEIAKEKVQISVSDNGVGISPETAAQLFTNKNIISKPGTQDEKGTGLGLVLCKEFIDKHKGKIGVKNKQDKGSEFYFSIPSYQD